MINAKGVDFNNPKIREQVNLYKEFSQRNFLKVFRQMHRLVNAAINKKLRELGHSDLSTRHLTVFDFLDFEGTNIVTLSQRAGISKQAMSKLVKEVTQVGYVQVKTDRKDSRVLLVSLTPKGFGFINLLREVMSQTKMELYSKALLTKEEGTTTFNVLVKLMSYLENYTKGDLMNIEERDN